MNPTKTSVSPKRILDDSTASALGAFDVQLANFLDTGDEILGFVDDALRAGDDRMARDLFGIAADTLGGAYGGTPFVIEELRGVAAFVDHSLLLGDELGFADLQRRADEARQVIAAKRRAGFRYRPPAERKSIAVAPASHRPARARRARCSSARRRGSRRVSRCASRGGDSGDPGGPEPALAGHTTTKGDPVRGRRPLARPAVMARA